MGDFINPFDAYSVTELSDAIQVLPNKYGQIGQLGIFGSPKGVTNNTVGIEIQNGVLTLLPFNTPGGPETQGSQAKRILKVYSIPKLTQDDIILPAEVTGLRAFGGNGQKQIETLVNDKLETCKSKHEITHEWIKAGALNGKILDADGTVYADLFADFGVTEKSVDFVLGTAGTDVRAKCAEVRRWVETNLKGDVMSGVMSYVSPEFYDKFVSHANVKDAFRGYQQAADRIGGDMRTGFTFGGITFVENLAEASNAAGSSQRFFAAGTGRAFPMGTSQSFRSYAAPADFNETVGKLGQMYYAKIVPKKFDRGYDVHTQSNPLSLCIRPSVLVKLISSN